MTDLSGTGMQPGAPQAPSANPLSMLPPSPEAQHDAALAKFNQLSVVAGHLTTMTKHLEDLSKLGDTVTPEDVLKRAGKMVAQGAFSPTQAATILTDMPQNPQALAAWIQQHVAAGVQAEAKLRPMLEQARMQLGGAALRAMTSHGSASMPMQSLAANASPSAPLAPGVPNAA